MAVRNRYYRLVCSDELWKVQSIVGKLWTGSGWRFSYGPTYSRTCRLSGKSDGSEERPPVLVRE